MHYLLAIFPSYDKTKLTLLTALFWSYIEQFVSPVEVFPQEIDTRAACQLCRYGLGMKRIESACQVCLPFLQKEPCAVSSDCFYRTFTSAWMFLLPAVSRKGCRWGAAQTEIFCETKRDGRDARKAHTAVLAAFYYFNWDGSPKENMWERR